MNIERGFRGKINDFADTGNIFQVKLTTTGGAVYDSCCFGVDSADKLSDDRYMVFYNQPVSPGQEIKYISSGNSSVYDVNLNTLPANISKLVFTVSIDGNGTMGQISAHTAEIIQNGCTVLKLLLNADDFQNEKAIIDLEIYKKSEWRIAAVARGFDGGLGELLKHYGGEIAEEVETAPSPKPVPVAETGSSLSTESQITDKIMKKISLSKDKVNLEKHVVNLSKCVVNLSKKSGVDLGNTSAKVVVALDYSGSMGTLYYNGTVQRTINKLVPLGLTFDDNGSIDMYLFQSNFRKFEDLNLSNYEHYVSDIIEKSGYDMGGTSYSPVLRAIIDGYSYRQGGFLGFGGKDVYVDAIVDDGDPTFILFITDGENADRAATDDIIRKSSEMNVFIQFIGIGNSSFNYLMQLDDMPGRKRDNTGFSKMADLDNASDNELYQNVLEQFSDWLKGLQ